MGRPQAATRAAAYLRVSTDRQDLEVQLTEIRQHAVRRGWELVETYSDDQNPDAGRERRRAPLSHLRQATQAPATGLLRQVPRRA